MGKRFTNARRMRFSECDTAGIAFYPRLVEGVNNTVEDWFETGLDFSFREMHLEAHCGVPTRSLQVEFENPAGLGELIEWSLQVTKLGRSSIQLWVEAIRPDGRRVLYATPTLIWCDFSGEGPKPAEIPAVLRERMMSYLRSDEDLAP